MLDPDGLTAIEWSANLIYSLAKYGLDSPITDETRWQDWARWVMTLPFIGPKGLPDPGGFGNWRDWAKQFNYLVERPQ